MKKKTIKKHNINKSKKFYSLNKKGGAKKTTHKVIDIEGLIGVISKFITDLTKLTTRSPKSSKENIANESKTIQEIYKNLTGLNFGDSFNFTQTDDNIEALLETTDDKTAYIEKLNTLVERLKTIINKTYSNEDIQNCANSLTNISTIQQEKKWSWFSSTIKGETPKIQLNKKILNSLVFLLSFEEIKCHLKAIRDIKLPTTPAPNTIGKPSFDLLLNYLIKDRSRDETEYTDEYVNYLLLFLNNSYLLNNYFEFYYPIISIILKDLVFIL